MANVVDVLDMLGKTVTKIEEVGDEVLIFTTGDGYQYRMYHEQDCCESVWLEDIAGDLNDLVGSELLMAEEASNQEDTEYRSRTWTFYKFATVKGYVTLRWCGESNGYYSETVRVTKTDLSEDFRKNLYQSIN